MPNTLTTGEVLEKGDYLTPTFDPETLSVPVLTGLLQASGIQLPAYITKSALISLFNSEIKAKLLEPQEEVNNSDATGTSKSAQGVSQNFDTGTEDSGWEYNNIFQSSARSRRRARVASRNTLVSSRVILPESRRISSQVSSRVALPESPQISPQVSSRVTLPEAPQISPQVSSRVILPESPQISPQVSSGNSSSMSPQISSVPYVNPSVPLQSTGNSLPESPQINSIPSISSQSDTSAQWLGLLPVRARKERNYTRNIFSSENLQAPRATFISSPRSNVLPRPHRVIRNQCRPFVSRRRLLIGFILVLIGALFEYKVESSPIGYCDSGSRSNEYLVELQFVRLEIEACREQKVASEEIVCPLANGFFYPETCTPCPQHATCYLEDVICDDGYLLKQHSLSFHPILSRIFDGLPGLGPVAFPSKCIEDPIRKRSISALEERIDSMLATEYGRRICANGFEVEEKPLEGREAWIWGMEIERLKDDMRAKFPAAENFDTLFGEAVKQLLDYGRVIKGKDSQGRIFLATKHFNMSWNCQIMVAVRRAWKEWRDYILSVILLVIFGICGRVHIAAKRNNDRHVSELVQLALDALRNQELSHHTNPTMTPTHYLSSLQLRDLILQDEHSIAKRARLWARVESIVEGNANVRANMEELPGGDELRVWRWVGTRRWPTEPYERY